MSKYAVPRVAAYLAKQEIRGRWHRKHHRVYLTINLHSETNALVRSVILSRFRDHIQDLMPGSYMTSAGQETATFFIYDLVELLRK